MRPDGLTADVELDDFERWIDVTGARSYPSVCVDLEMFGNAIENDALKNLISSHFCSSS